MTDVSRPAQPPAPGGVRHLEVDAEHAGQRLDNYLIARLKGVPKTRIYKILRTGEVRINKGRAKPDYRVQTGDVVRIPPLRMAQPGAGPDPGRYTWLEDCILYEDDSLLAINKPAGLAVHAGSGISTGLIEALRALRPQAAMLELVHRLDRDTSGCLLVAKSRSALLSLHAALRDGGMDKRYLALVRGAWRGGARRIEFALENHRPEAGERRVQVAEEGKDSASRFAPQRLFLGASLMEIRLLTGRTHQARVHAAHDGHPIAGDDKYGDRDFNRQMRAHGLNRLFLHAASLRLPHPKTGATLEIQAPLPPELEAVLDSLSTKP